MNRRTTGFWLGIAAALLLVGLLSGSRQQSGPPLHPESTDPTGTRALMILLDERGATIEDGLPSAETNTALLLADQLDDQSRSQLEAWAGDGGTLIVTDSSSILSPSEASFDDGDVLVAGDCTIGGLDGFQLEAGSFLSYPHRDPGFVADDWCFGDEGRSHVHVRREGAGRIIAVGGGLAFANENLDEADNAVVAARLLLDGGSLFAVEAGSAGQDPSTDRPTIAVLYDPVVAAGSRTLGDLIPTEAKWAAGQLLVAFVLYVLWRLPRFGRPVPEPQPVELPASLLVRATGELHRRSGAHGQASATLRADLDRRLRRQLRASPELPTADVIGTAAAAGAIGPDVVARAVAGPAAVDGQQLSALVTDVDAVNHAVLAIDKGAPSDGDPPRPPAPESAAGVGVGASITNDDPTIGDHP